MKKIAIIMLLALTLASCTNTTEKKDSKVEDKTTKIETKQEEVSESKQVEQEEKKASEASTKTIVSKGDIITVTYTGSTTDGVVFDASSKHPGQPLSFVAGAGQMIKGFDEGVIGMKLGETKTLNIPAKDAYGESKEIELKDADFQAIEKVGLKKEDLKVGENKVKVGEKEVNVVKIIKIENGKYIAENSNKLAGKDLIFEVKIESIK